MKKSIGILTFYKSINYGAVLQSYALQRYLESLGYKAEIIQYQDLSKRATQMPKYKRMIRNFWYDIIKRKLLKEPRWFKMLDFINQYDNLSESVYSCSKELYENPPHYDCYVVGSDQVWNPLITGNDESFFLGFAPYESRKISYGASMGKSSFFEQNTEKYRNLLSQMDAISVREKDLAEKIEQMLGLKAEQVLDPTLMLNKCDWEKVISDQKPVVDGKYILCYYMPGDSLIEHAIDNISMNLSKKTGLQVINLGLKDNKRLRFRKNDLFGMGPKEFLWLFSNAEYVVTNSFHGTAFSVNFNKPLYVPIKTVSDLSETLSSRMLSLIKLLGIEDCIVNCSDISEDYNNQIMHLSYDYSSAMIKLNDERKKSHDFITRSI